MKGEIAKISIVRLTFISILSVIAIWCLYWVLIEVKYDKYEVPGQFGDMFGAINSLFTGLAFAGVIITIFLQSQELGLQRDELKLTRNELELTRNEFAKQNKTLKYQRFENTFFHLIDQYRSLGKERFSGKITSSFHSPEFIKLASFGHLQQYYNIANRSTYDGVSVVSLGQEIQDEFRAHIKTFESIIEYVYLKNKGKETRGRYLKFFFSQLTNFELILYFYHFNLRQEEPPIGFSDYQSYLFNSLHGSIVMPGTHYMMIVNRNLA